MGILEQKGYMMTIGADFSVRTINVDNVEYTCQIWDLAGQERFSAVRGAYYRGTNGALLVYDVTLPETFNNIRSWIEELLKNNGNLIVPLVLIGNKTDLREHGNAEHITREAGEEYARSIAGWCGMIVPFFETSFEESENTIEIIFERLARSILTLRQQ